MKVLIIGGAGFLGSFLADKLLDKGWTVSIIDRVAPSDLHAEVGAIIKRKNAKYWQFDLDDISEVTSVGYDHTHVVHLAAQLGVENVLQNPSRVLWENVKLTKCAIDIAGAQHNLKLFMFASTSEVYAGSVLHKMAEIPTTEVSPLVISEIPNPRTSYMLSKIYGEAMTQHCGLPALSIRPHNIYGPRMGFKHVIPQLYKKIRNTTDGTIEVFSPDHTRSFCYIDDATEMIAGLMLTPNLTAHSVNIGTQNEEITIRGLAEKIIKISNRKLRIVDGEETLGSPQRRAPNMENCFDLSGYVSQITLETGLKKTLSWYRDHLNGC